MKWKKPAYVNWPFVYTAIALAIFMSIFVYDRITLRATINDYRGRNERLTLRFDETRADLAVANCQLDARSAFFTEFARNIIGLEDLVVLIARNQDTDANIADLDLKSDNFLTTVEEFEKTIKDCGVQHG